MRRTPDPRWWTAIGVFGTVLGALFWVAVIVVGWHFISKYW